ncbi:MAG TPA: lamin tail domain-containing protein, partial [bacterium]|nr:lamin tail domain-containing protein [bacterium]
QSYKIDAIGWGAAQYVFEYSKLNSIGDLYIERKAHKNADTDSMSLGGAYFYNGNSIDADINNFDFIIKTSADIQNSNSAIEFPPYLNKPQIPAITSPMNNLKTSDTSVNIYVSAAQENIGDTLYLYRNNYLYSQLLINSVSMTFNDVQLVLNAYNNFYCLTGDSVIPVLKSDSSNVINLLNDKSGPVPSISVFEDTIVTNPLIKFNSFEDSTSIIWYQLLIDNSSDFANPYYYTSPTNSVQIDTPLEQGKTYYVKIRAADEFNNTGNYSDSMTIRIIDILTVPSIIFPNSLIDTNTLPLAISGTVSGNPEIDTAVLYINDVARYYTDLFSAGNDSGFNFSVSELSDDTHEIYVRVFNRINGIYSDKSNRIKILFDSTGPNPSAVSFDDKYSTSAILNFDDFTDSSQIIKYYIYIAQDADFADSLIYSANSSYYEFQSGYGVYYIKIQAEDKFGNKGGFSNTDTFALKVFETSNHIVFSEIQVGGANTTDEFIEIYNPTEENISLNGWSIQRYTSSGALQNPIVADFGEAVIRAKSYYLLT